MRIPPAWAKAEGEAASPARGRVRLAAWGWGESVSAARGLAADRLRRMVERVHRGEPFPGRYAYETRPPREEILGRVDAGGEGGEAVLTRNRYGAEVLNAARLLVLDVDFPPRGLLYNLRLFVSERRWNLERAALDRLRGALARYGRATFRIYRTAAGLRAIAVDRGFEAGWRETEALMQDADTDPAYLRLCRAQKCFRARLTPKPWRCGLPLPPGAHPREDAASRERFAQWLEAYARAGAERATCAYLETIGSGSPRGAAAKLVALHDRATRCEEALPLA